MNDKEITEIRGLVIDRAIHFETLVSTIISQHYLKRVAMPFIKEVLYDESFTLGFKLKILLKTSPELGGKVEQQLRRMITIRNICAHVGLRLSSHPGADGESHIPDFKKGGEVDFGRLWAEYKELDESVLGVLMKLIESKGVLFESAAPPL